jgi:hypothetical protein
LQAVRNQSTGGCTTELRNQYRNRVAVLENAANDQLLKEFFDNKRSLTNALAYGSGLTGPAQFSLNNYLNRGMSQEIDSLLL